jgi:hypothetical protein
LQMNAEFGWVQFLKVIQNYKTGEWDLIAVGGVDQGHLLESYPSEGQAMSSAVLTAKYIIGRDIEIKAISGIPDCTCRVRQCMWNINDSCLHAPRSANLPPPQADYSQVSWTEENSIMPAICPLYEKAEL